MVISNHHPVPAPLSFLPALVGKYQASIFVERNANAQLRANPDGMKPTRFVCCSCVHALVQAQSDQPPF